MDRMHERCRVHEIRLDGVVAAAPTAAGAGAKQHAPEELFFILLMCGCGVGGARDGGSTDVHKYEAKV